MDGSNTADAEASASPPTPERPALALVRDGATNPNEFRPETPWCTPPHYELRHDGVFELKLEKRSNGKGETRLVPTPVLIAHSPVWLTAQVLDIDTGTWAYSVASHTPRGQLVERTLSGGTIADRSKLVALSDYGFPVNSSNVIGIVKYLGAALAANGRENLPTTLSASRMIWRKMSPGATRPDGFNLGHRLMRAGEPDAVVVPAVHSGIDPTHFERFTANGTEQAWADAVLPWLAKYPIVATMACAGLASPLCHLLHIPNRIFEMAGNSGLGKTSTAQLAMSLWGNPDEKKLPGWDGTAAGLERVAAMHGNALLIVDENAQHGRGEKEKGSFAKALFKLAEGKSRQRSNEQLGLRQQDVWRLNIITTGEMSGQASTEHGGILSRLISFWGSPLGGASEETGRRIKETMQTALEHHGHTAPKWIKALLELTDEQVEGNRARAVELQAEYASKAPAGAESNLVARWSQSYAAMHLAAEWLEDEYPTHLPEGTLTGHLLASWTDACSKVRSIDPSNNALDVLRGWLAANSSRLLNSDTFAAGGHTEVIGAIRTHDVAIIPEMLDKARIIPDLDAVLKGWHDSGLLVTDHDRPGRHKKTVKIGRNPVKCIVFVKELLWPEMDDEGRLIKPPAAPTPAPVLELESRDEDVTPVVPVAIPAGAQTVSDDDDEMRRFEAMVEAVNL